MPFRTNEDLVGSIIEVDTDIDLAPFIEAANALVTDVCVPAGYNAARLELIERWLSAHFYTCRDPRQSFEKAGRVSQSNETKIELGLNLSKYGQMAMRLDTKGGLAALDRKVNSAKGKFVGTPRAYWLGKDCR